MLRPTAAALALILILGIAAWAPGQAKPGLVGSGQPVPSQARPDPAWIDLAVEWILAAGTTNLRQSRRRPEWVDALEYRQDELFSMHRGRYGIPFILVDVNGVTFDLPFDTGNMVGVSLSSHELEALPLQESGTWERLDSAGAVVGRFRYFDANTVRVWGRVWRDQRIYEFDGADLPGLIGPQYLLGMRYTLDYPNGLMAVSESALAGHPGGLGYEAIPLIPSTEQPGMILFYGAVNGRRVLIQADTGKSRCTIDPDLARELGLNRNEHGFRVEQLEIGSHSFRVPSAKPVVLAPIDEGTPDPILVGIGSDILSQVLFTVDTLDGRVLLPRYAEPR